MLQAKEYTTLRDVEGIPRFPKITSQFEGKTFHFPKYTAEGHRYFKIENGCAIDISASDVVDIEALELRDGGEFCSSVFKVSGQKYYIVITDDRQVYVFEYKNMWEAATLSQLGVRATDIPDSIVLRERHSMCSFSEVPNVLLTIRTMTNIDEDTACRLIYREMKKLTDQHSSRYLLVMRIFQTPEFINAVGAAQWFRKATDYGKEPKVLSFVDFGEQPLTSLKYLENHRMECLGQDGPYRLLSSWTGGGAVWLKGESAFIRINEESFTLDGSEMIRLPLGSDILLDNATMKHQLKLADNPVITVVGNNSITVREHDSCIYAHGIITIKGSGTLRLNCSTRSAAIGSGAESQSYGRYVSAFRPAKIMKIVIDGVQLDVHSDTPNFSIGTYGENNDIPIEVINGGKVTGVPELLGKVVLQSVGQTNTGSTKIEGDAVYQLNQSNVDKATNTNRNTDVLQASHSFTKPKSSKG